MLEATIVSQRNVIEKKDAIIAELRDRHVGGPATPCSQATGIGSRKHLVLVFRFEVDMRTYERIA